MSPIGTIFLLLVFIVLFVAIVFLVMAFVVSRLDWLRN